MSEIKITKLTQLEPQHLLELAEREPRKLSQYSGAIRVLRMEKGFSYREIADWLTERGVEADYNSVYRVYMKSLSKEEEQDYLMHEAEHEENEDK